MAVELDGVFYGMQAGIAAMKAGGGAIVDVASIAANVAEPMLGDRRIEGRHRRREPARAVQGVPGPCVGRSSALFHSTEMHT